MYPHKMTTPTKVLCSFLLFALLSVTGCDDDDTADTANDLDNNHREYAVIATVAPDYSSGAHAVINAEPPRLAQTNLMPTISDLGISTYGRHFYRFERYQADNVSKFDVTAPNQVVWQFSTLDAEDEANGIASSNPYALIVKEDHKGYLLRYGAPTAWIVDPSVTQAGPFKTGSLDLSPYNDADGSPEMTAGVLVDERLFIVMQRLDRNASYVPGEAFVAVFDTRTDTEIATGVDNALGVYGIPLPIKNPVKMQYLPATGLIYIAGVGRYASTWSGTPAEYTGGIVTLDPVTYRVVQVLDDGPVIEGYPDLQFNDLAVVNADQGYFIGLFGRQDAGLFRFNPQTGAVEGAAVAGLFAQDLASIAIDSQAKLWVGIAAADAPGVMIIDTATDGIEEALIGLGGLNPAGVGTGITFCQVAPTQ